MSFLHSLIETINHGGRYFCEIAQGMFIQVSILIVLLMVLDLFLRAHPRVSACLRYGLWLLVLVKLVLPPSLALPTGIGYYVNRSVPVEQSTSQGYMPSVAVVESPSDYRTGEVMHGDTLSSLQVSATTQRPPLQRQGLLFLLWLGIVTWLLSVLVRRYAKMRREIRRSLPAPDFVCTALQNCCTTLRLRHPVEVALSESLRGPVVCGFRRPLILLPVSLPQQLSPEALRAVLGHELIHVQRRDTWVNLVQSLLQIVYFFHPLVWVANRITGRVRELAVDEAVLATFNLKVNHYTGTLIDIAEMAYKKPALNVCCVGLAESREVLEGRITHMLQQRSSDRARFGWIGGIVILLLAALLLPMGQGRLAAEPEPIPEVSVPELPEGIAELFELDKDELLVRFGEPENIFYGSERYTLDNLPERFFLAYEDISFGIDNGSVGGITLLDEKYVFSNGMCVGNTEAEIIAALGPDYAKREFENKDFLEYEHLGLMIEIYKPERIAREINIESDYGDPAKLEAYRDAPEFAGLLHERVAQLDIDKADRQAVMALFGAPIKYVWGSKTYSPDNLPLRYIMMYPASFRVFMVGDRIQEIRHEQGSPYVYLGAIQNGTPLADVIDILGAPVETVTGEENAFRENVLYKDIDGNTGHCYYHRPDQHVRLWFANYQVAAIYMTRSDYRDGPASTPSDPEFSRLLSARVAELDIDTADLVEVKRIFGEPERYVWGNEVFKADQLPEQFIAAYPNGFDVFMSGNRIVEIRFDRGTPNYLFKGIQLGATIEDVIAALGEPDRVVEGKQNTFVDRVLYRDIAGRKGHCYYHRSDHHVRLWFSSNKVVAIYVTRSDYSDGGSNEPYDEDFGAALAGRIAQLDIDNADRAAVEVLFGKPLKYLWGSETFSEDELKGNYILEYPCDFSVWMKDEQIMEIRHERSSRYAYASGVAIGSSVAEVLGVLGDPIETVVGEENEFKDYVLYRDIEDREGHCYYHRSDKQIRLFFWDYKVIAIYMTRTDFPTH
ncbi:M56 family metallopeptidase [Planctomycetota bacterium]